MDQVSFLKGGPWICPAVASLSISSKVLLEEDSYWNRVLFVAVGHKTSSFLVLRPRPDRTWLDLSFKGFWKGGVEAPGCFSRQGGCSDDSVWPRSSSGELFRALWMLRGVKLRSWVKNHQTGWFFWMVHHGPTLRKYIVFLKGINLAFGGWT